MEWVVFITLGVVLLTCTWVVVEKWRIDSRSRKVYEENTPIERLIKAWEDPGPVPEYHYETKDRLFKMWPSLSKAIEEVILEEKSK